MLLNLVSKFISILGVFTLFIVALVAMRFCIHDFIDLKKNNSGFEGEGFKEKDIETESYGDEL